MLTETPALMKIPSDGGLGTRSSAGHRRMRLGQGRCPFGDDARVQVRVRTVRRVRHLGKRAVRERLPGSLDELPDAVRLVVGDGAEQVAGGGVDAPAQLPTDPWSPSHLLQTANTGPIPWRIDGPQAGLVSEENSGGSSYTRRGPARA